MFRVLFSLSLILSSQLYSVTEMDARSFSALRRFLSGESRLPEGGPAQRSLDLRLLEVRLSILAKDGSSKFIDKKMEEFFEFSNYTKTLKVSFPDFSIESKREILRATKGAFRVSAWRIKKVEFDGLGWAPDVVSLDCLREVTFHLSHSL